MKGLLLKLLELNLFCEDKNEFELFEELVLNGLYVFIFIIF